MALSLHYRLRPHHRHEFWQMLRSSGCGCCFLHKQIGVGSYYFINLLTPTAAQVPEMGAKIYIHKNEKCPEIRAGAKDLAGFIDAPLIGPANIASNKITQPMANPANIPFSF